MAYSKTNWTINDRFNYVDYNRIKNNLTYLYELAQEVYKQFSIVDMGADIEDYTGWFGLRRLLIILNPI